MPVLFLGQSHIQLMYCFKKGPHILAGLSDEVQSAGTMALSFSIFMEAEYLLELTSMTIMACMFIVGLGKPRDIVFEP